MHSAPPMAVVPSPFYGPSGECKRAKSMTKFPTLSAMLDEGYAMRGEKRWPTYLGGKLDRSKFVSASEIGNCSRRIKFGKVSRPLAFDRWGFAERGHLIEAWAVDLIRTAIFSDGYSEEWHLVFAGEAQFSFTDGSQSGTPDGLLIHRPTGTSLVLDIKSVDPRTNFDKLPKPKHVKQVMQNADLIRRRTLYDVVGGVLFYIDASDLQRRKEVDVELDEEVIASLREKAERIMSAAKPEDLPAEGLYMDKECGECPFSERCGAQVAADNEAAKKMQQMERAIRNGFFG